MRALVLTLAGTVTAVLGVASSSVYVSSKRTMASSNGGNDSTFFQQYLGVIDPDSTHSDCLDRWLLRALPDGFGIHFPTSTIFPDQPGPEQLSSSSPAWLNFTLDGWDQKRVSTAYQAFELSEWSSLFDMATALYVPDLGPLVHGLTEDGVPFLTRQTRDSEGTFLWTILLVTPGNGAPFEVQAPACSGCDVSGYVPFGESECAVSHELRRPIGLYNDTWERAALVAWNSTDGGFPAGIITRLHTAVLDLTEAQSYYNTFFTGSTLEVTTGQLSGCDVAAASVYSRPFDGEVPTVVADHLIDLIYVENRGAAAKDSDEAPGLTQWVAWAEAMDASFAGLGFGYHKIFDYHIKINDVVDEVHTTGNTTLDHHALLHENLGVPYHPFNLSHGLTCPSSDGGSSGGDRLSSSPPDFSSSGMMYSRGIKGTAEGFELWGPIDGSFLDFVEHPLFGWTECSATDGCVQEFPVTACLESSSETSADGQGLGIIRGRLFNDYPSNLARLTITCPTGTTVSNITFASFGKPSGACASGFTLDSGGCHDPDSQSISSALCMSQSDCDLPTGAFGRPAACESDDLWLAVEATCT